MSICENCSKHITSCMVKLINGADCTEYSPVKSNARSILDKVRIKLNEKAFGIDHKYHSWVIDVEDVMEILNEHFN